jgi:hypothetical protein
MVVSELVVPEPQQVDRKTVSKIRIKGTIYYITKIPNDVGDYLIYELLDDSVGRQIGRKTRENKCIFTL